MGFADKTNPSSKSRTAILKELVDFKIKYSPNSEILKKMKLVLSDGSLYDVYDIPFFSWMTAPRSNYSIIKEYNNCLKNFEKKFLEEIRNKKIPLLKQLKVDLEENITVDSDMLDIKKTIGDFISKCIIYLDTITNYYELNLQYKEKTLPTIAGLSDLPTRYYPFHKLVDY